MMNSNLHIRRKALLSVALLMLTTGFQPLTASPDVNMQRRDSLQRRHVSSLRSQAQHELPDLRHRMMTSPQPVEIRQQGRNLCVTSRHNQLLPVYTVSGSLYSSVRLNVGTNWLSGLPRGSYIINNQKYTIN